MSFKRAAPRDLPIGIGPSKPLYSLWGECEWPIGRKPKSFDEQRAALAKGLYVWDGDGEALSIPADERFEGDINAISAIEFTHDKLRQLHDQADLPLNFVDVLWSAAVRLQSCAARAPERALFYLYLCSHPSNSLLNSIHCALLCELMGARLNIPASDRTQICAAALTMNWTILDLQDNLSSQGRSPTPGERAQIINHPSATTRLLEECGVQHPIWIDCCLQHHEDPSGMGYPSKLAAAQIHEASHLLRLSDRYVALICSRAHRSGLSSAQALDQLSEPRAGFSSRHIETLRQSIGDITPGSPVLLPQGEIGYCLRAEGGSFTWLDRNGGYHKTEISQLHSLEPGVALPDGATHVQLRKSLRFDDLT